MAQNLFVDLKADFDNVDYVKNYSVWYANSESDTTERIVKVMKQATSHLRLVNSPQQLVTNNLQLVNNQIQLLT